MVDPRLPPLCWMTSHVGTCPYSHCTRLSSCFSKLLLVGAKRGRWYIPPGTLLSPFTMVTELLQITHRGWTYDFRPAACPCTERAAGCLGVCHYGQWATTPPMVEPQHSGRPCIERSHPWRRDHASAAPDSVRLSVSLLQHAVPEPSPCVVGYRSQLWRARWLVTTFCYSPKLSSSVPSLPLRLLSYVSSPLGKNPGVASGTH
jgi:hypothetical protein